MADPLSPYVLPGSRALLQAGTVVLDDDGNQGVVLVAFGDAPRVWVLFRMGLTGTYERVPMSPSKLKLDLTNRTSRCHAAWWADDQDASKLTESEQDRLAWYIIAARMGMRVWPHDRLGEFRDLCLKLIEANDG